MIDFLENKTILITGGTGSFGTTMVERLLKTKIKQIRIFSRDETKQYLMRQKFTDSRIKYFIGDVRQKNTLQFAMTNVDFVFHASALKQVPSCEEFPFQAVKTNIVGSTNVLEMAIQKNVKKIIMLSTDKAVYPINAMGISKAMMERIALSYSKQNHNTDICITRYGNVMASRGSVIPLFLQQIKTDNKIKITSGSMTRFLMSLPQAIELVMFALENGKNGEILVQKSPACSVLDLAKTMSQKYGVYSTRIEEIGIRPGQKMHQTLVTAQQMSKVTQTENYFIIGSQIKNKNVNEYTSLSTEQLNISQISNKLDEVVAR